MKTTKFELLGWLIAAAIAGIIVASGFQGSVSSAANVDSEKVIGSSDVWKAQTAELQKASDLRHDMWTFASQNPVISVDQLVQLKKDWLKTNPTDAEKAELDKLKKDVADSCTKCLDIQHKTTRTTDEIQELDEFQQRIDHTNQALPQMNREFLNDIDQMKSSDLSDDEVKVRAAVAIVAKAQGYTIVFDTNSAPYAAHNITDATLVQMNKK